MNTRNPPDDIAAARRVLETETEGLAQLARSIDDSFTQAVGAVHAMKEKHAGRLIVAGIGKSG
ncbi:MAG: KpsF/GutQ family sugar-phosphate isomerase, partial [Alphaproteobacteria bacterium]|nr:KpsF/GutQ family sugar-phosphate isomerase [Alphaproteobacteria bacterium]